MNEEVIRIEDILHILRKRWRLILSITLIATLTSAIVSFFLIAPKYQAETKLFIGKETNPLQDKPYDNNDVQMYQKLLKTYAEVIQTKDLIEHAIESGNLDLKAGDVLSNLTVTPRADTQILEVSYTNTNPIVSQKVIETVTNQFINYSTELIANGNVKIIESARVPENPVSPNKKVNIAIAFLLGLMVSIGLSFFIEFMDNTFKTKEQIESILGLPVMGIIPGEFNFE